MLRRQPMTGGELAGVGILPRYWRGWRIEYAPGDSGATHYYAWRYGCRICEPTRAALAARIEREEERRHAPRQFYPLPMRRP